MDSKPASVIAKRRQELGMSQDELARLMGYKDRSSISRIESDARNLPNKKIATLAKILGIDPVELVYDGISEKKDIAPYLHSKEEIALAKIAGLYTQLNPTGQDKVCGYAQDLIDTGAYEPKSLQETISAYTIASVAAGIGIDNSQVDPRFRTYGTTELPKHDFCVDVSGDSMFPTICDGDTAFCVTNFERLNGKIYVVSINGEEVIKRCYFETDQLTLVSDNEEYDDRIITGYDLETVRIVGYVVGWETPI